MITESKNASIECALANETAVICSKYVAELRVQHKALLSQFRSHCGGKNKASKRIQDFKEFQSKKAKSQMAGAKDGSKDPFDIDSTDSEPEDSQESLIEEICSVKADLESFEMRKVAAFAQEDECRIKIQKLSKPPVV